MESEVENIDNYFDFLKRYLFIILKNLEFFYSNYLNNYYNFIG